jgi:ABC-type uncharacterized transport system auxiliary subunit
MKKRLLQLFYISSITGILLFVTTGCLWGLGQKPYVAVKYYDLDTPPQIVLKKIQVKFLPFDSTEPVKYKMVYRDSNCQMVLDDHNKWIQPPSMLLTRYMQGAFKQSGITSKNEILIISGNIFMFRIDLQKNTASLGVNYVIKTSVDDDEKTVFQNSTTFTQKFEKQSPENFVKALSKCAEKLILTIKEDIEKTENHMTAKKK